MKSYHKLVKAGVVSPAKGMRYWVDAKGDLYSTDTNSAEYSAELKVKTADKAKKRSEKIAKLAKIKANKKAKQLAALEARKAKILSQ